MEAEPTPVVGELLAYAVAESAARSEK